MVDNHNLVMNNGYEIYRPDGSLRTSSFTDRVPPCEGTFSLEVKDTEGRPKSFEEHPIRSLQGGFISDYLANTSTYAYRMVNYPYKENVTPFTRTSLVSGSDSMHGGIGLGALYNKSSGRFGKYILFTGVPRNSEEPYITSSSQDMYPHYDPQANAIIFSMARTTIPLTGGSATGAGFKATNTTETATNYYTWFCDPCTAQWDALDSIRVTYNFAFPSTSESTITKNFILDMFGFVYPNFHLKDYEDHDVDVKRSSSTSYAFANASHIYGAAQNQVNRGIVLGDSNTAVTWEDAHLNGPIPTSKLRPGSESASDFVGMTLADNATKCFCTHARSFTNISDEAVTIREAGVYAYADNTTYSVTSAGSFLLVHWLTGDVVVGAGETIRVYWKPTIVAG